jgi:hypothetical protein
VLRHHSASFLLSWLTALCGLYCATMLQVCVVLFSVTTVIRGCTCSSLGTLCVNDVAVIVTVFSGFVAFRFAKCTHSRETLRATLPVAVLMRCICLHHQFTVD